MFISTLTFESSPSIGTSASSLLQGGCAGVQSLAAWLQERSLSLRQSLRTHYYDLQLAQRYRLWIEVRYPTRKGLKVTSLACRREEANVRSRYCSKKIDRFQENPPALFAASLLSEVL